MKNVLSVLLAALVTIACSGASDTGEPFSSRHDEWQSAMNVGDPDGIAALYAEDARVMPPNGPATTGRDAVRAAFGAMIDSGAKVELNPIDTQSSGDIAYNVGVYTLTVDGELADEGKYIETWRRGADGEWLMTNDIWNSDRPAMGGGGERTHVVAFHEVEDFDRWIAAWRGENGRHDQFKAHGVAHAHTLQSPDNPNLTGLVMSVHDMDAFNAFLASKEGAEAAAADGVDLERTTILIETD